MGDMIARGLAKQSLEKGENLTAQLADTTKTIGVILNAGSTQNQFISAANAAIAQNKPLVIENGTYDLGGLNYTANGNLQIIGQDKNNTILKNLGSITVTSDFRLENIFVSDITGSNAIILNLSSFSEIIVRNVKADNSNNTFTSSLRANAFISYTNDVETKGIKNIVLENNEISNFASYAFRLRGYVEKGIIQGNKIKNIGYDTNASVFAIQGGYQSNTENVTLANFQNVDIQHNSFENIYSKLTTTAETGEGHAILCNGRNLRIRYNTIKNIYGGGRTEAHLDSGFDHEAIYTKADDVLFEGNYIENGSGEDGQGSIVAKAGSRIKVLNNEIRNLFGTGVTLEGVSDSEITGNKIILTGSYVTKSKAVSCVIANKNTEKITISNNTLMHNRPKTSGQSGSSVITAGFSSGILTIDNNYLSTISDQVLNISSTLDLAIIRISNNDIVYDAKGINIYGGAENVLYEIEQNTFLHKSTLIPIYFSTDNIAIPKGDMSVKRNKFIVSSVVSQVVQMDTIRSFVIEGNDFVFNAKATRVVFLNPRSNNTTFKSINNNKVTNLGADTFFLLQTAASNIGQLMMNNNSVKLGTGRLFSTTGSTAPTVDYLALMNNFIKSDTTTDKVIATGTTPATNYTSQGNIGI